MRFAPALRARTFPMRNMSDEQKRRMTNKSQIKQSPSISLPSINNKSLPCNFPWKWLPPTFAGALLNKHHSSNSASHWWMTKTLSYCKARSKIPQAGARSAWTAMSLNRVGGKEVELRFGESSESVQTAVLKPVWKSLVIRLTFRRTFSRASAITSLPLQTNPLKFSQTFAWEGHSHGAFVKAFAEAFAKAFAAFRMHFAWRGTSIEPPSKSLHKKFYDAAHSKTIPVRDPKCIQMWGKSLGSHLWSEKSLHTFRIPFGFAARSSYKNFLSSVARCL